MSTEIRVRKLNSRLRIQIVSLHIYITTPPSLTISFQLRTGTSGWQPPALACVAHPTIPVYTLHLLHDRPRFNGVLTPLLPQCATTAAPETCIPTGRWLASLLRTRCECLQQSWVVLSVRMNALCELFMCVKSITHTNDAHLIFACFFLKGSYTILASSTGMLR